MQVSEYVLGTFDANATAAALDALAQPFAEEATPTGAVTRYVVVVCSRPLAHLTCNTRSLARSFHAHQFTGGTPCDLTGGRRSTEVRFVCPPDGAPAPSMPPAAPGSGATGGGDGGMVNFIEGVKEPTTCHYVLTFATPLLCTHAAFRQQESPVAHIRCSPLEQPGGEGGEGGTTAAERSAEHAAASAVHDEL